MRLGSSFPAEEDGQDREIYDAYEKITRMAKKSSDCSRLKQRSESGTSKPPAKEDVIKKVKNEGEKGLEGTPQSPEAETRPIVHLGFEDRLIGKLWTDYTVPLIGIDDVGHPWVLSRRQHACLRKLVTNEQYEHIAMFLHVVIIRKLHYTNVFLSK